MITKPVFNGKPKILAIDDDEDLLTLIKNQFKKKGYNIEVSSNAKDLLDMLFIVSPDIVLTDIQMNGINGRNVCRLIKTNESTKDISVLFLSGNSDVDIITAECGADGFLRKPFKWSEAEDEINRVLKISSH